jgi:hypothetical protein
VNAAYAQLASYYQLPATELQAEVAPTAATATAIRAWFSTPQPPITSIPKRTLWHLWKELHRVKDAGRADADVVDAVRLSQTYYALVAKYHASDPKPAFLLIFQDDQENDPLLKRWYWRETVIPE